MEEIVRFKVKGLEKLQKKTKNAKVRVKIAQNLSDSMVLEQL